MLTFKLVVHFKIIIEIVLLIKPFLWTSLSKSFRACEELGEEVDRGRSCYYKINRLGLILMYR